MNFLPVVARELRVAARRRSTYWLRSLTAGVVLVVWFCLVLGVQQSRPMAVVGQDLFNALGVLALAFLPAGRYSAHGRLPQ